MASRQHTQPDPADVLGHAHADRHRFHIRFRSLCGRYGAAASGRHGAAAGGRHGADARAGPSRPDVVRICRTAGTRPGAQIPAMLLLALLIGTLLMTLGFTIVWL